MFIFKLTTNCLISSKLKAVRKNKHLTLNEVSNKLGISKLHLFLYENNLRSVPGKIIYSYSDKQILTAKEQVFFGALNSNTIKKAIRTRWYLKTLYSIENLFSK